MAILVIDLLEAIEVQNIDRHHVLGRRAPDSSL